MSYETDAFFRNTAEECDKVLREAEKKASEDPFYNPCLDQILQEAPKLLHFPLHYKSLLSATMLLLGLDYNYPFNNIKK